MVDGLCSEENIPIIFGIFTCELLGAHRAHRVLKLPVFVAFVLVTLPQISSANVPCSIRGLQPPPPLFPLLVALSQICKIWDICK